MPEKLRFEPQEVARSGDFEFRANTEMAASQANETFLVDANKDRCIGDNGESLGFAKKQFGPDEKVQRLRERQHQKLSKQLDELGKKHPEAKQWLNDRNLLANLAQPIESAEKILLREKELLKKAQDAEEPDPKAIEAAEADVFKAEQEVKRLKAIQADPGPERERLAKAAQANPVVMEYAKLNAQVIAAGNLVQSIDNVTMSSGNLYENQMELQGDPSLGGDRALLTRAVASHEADKFLGLNVCAQEKFGIDEQGQVIGISVQCDGVGVRSEAGRTELDEKVTAYLDIDYADENVQKGLYDLEALDYITGQLDRHPGNIFVDPNTGKVTGIDNDLAFPEVEREQMIERNQELPAKVVAGMPRMMHEDTADKLLAVDPQAYRAKLASVRPPNGGPPMGKKEIDGSVKRLQALQSAIRNKEGIEIVPKFNRQTYESSINAQVKAGGAAQSYIGAIHKEIVPSKAAYKAGSPTTQPRVLNSDFKAKISPHYAAFQKMDENRQADYRGLQRSLDKVDDKLEAANKQRGKLDHPKLKDRLASLRHGGIEGEKRHLDKKIASLKAERTELEHRIEQFDNEQKIPLAERAQQSKQEQGQQEPKTNVGEALRQQSAVKAPAADKHGAGDNKVGAQMGKRPAIKVGSTSSSSVRH